MKITVSSPDGLGDFILRVPVLRALLEGGHELQLFLRQPAAGMAEEIFPGVERHEIAADPYHPDIRRKKCPFTREHAAIRKFSPDLYVASLFALNFFDEVWFGADKWRVPVAGFATADEFWPSGTIADPRVLSDRFDIRVEVPVALPEIEKSRRLGSAVLGSELPAHVPRLEPGRASIEDARNILRQHGLQEGGYWVACAGGRSGLRMKDWGWENWKEFFSAALPADGRPAVFFGNTKERDSVEKIRAGGFRSINLASDPPPVPVSFALAAMSCGYVGRDSGVMHMACAAGKPVLAAFGGGHWGRFLPSSGPAVVVTQAMSCRMCDFACPHERPHCVAEIKRETMLEAWRRLPSAAGVEVVEQAADPRFDTVPADAARAFAEERADGLRRRESAARGPAWRRILQRAK